MVFLEYPFSLISEIKDYFEAKATAIGYDSLSQEVEVMAKLVA